MLKNSCSIKSLMRKNWSIFILLQRAQIKRIPGAPASGLTLSKPESETKNDLNNIRFCVLAKFTQGKDRIKYLTPR